LPGKYNGVGSSLIEQQINVPDAFLCMLEEKNHLGFAIWVVSISRKQFKAVNDIHNGFYQVRQGRTWSRIYKSPSSPPPTRFRIFTNFLTTF
jgi:hypothetical protein